MSVDGLLTGSNPLIITVIPLFLGAYHVQLARFSCCYRFRSSNPLSSSNEDQFITLLLERLRTNSVLDDD